MTEEEIITDVRLMALETIVQKILASNFSQMTPEQSVKIKDQMADSCRKYDVFGKSGPVLVDTVKADLYAAHVDHLFRIVEEREVDIRERQNLPPLNR
jgi:hypothetical protein